MNAVAQKEQAPLRAQREPEREYVAPPVNIFEDKDGYILEADLPGVNKEGLEVTIDGNTLTIVGCRQDQEVPEAELLFRESPRADFRRSFDLDPAIDAKKVTAKIEQGILTLQLPKAEEVKPRKIEVSG
jgi:HSP20 family protein